MKYILFAIYALLIVTIVTSVIVRNPHKLILIIGKKGAGKSLYCVKQMIRYYKRGWDVYTDMTDVKINGVHIIDAKDLEHFTPKKHSAVFLDEAGLTFDNRKFKTFADGLNEWFKLQRKYKCVVFVNSQGMDIDLKIRLLVDRIVLLVPIMDVYTLYRPIRRDITLTDPVGDSESRVADKLEFQGIFTWRLIYMPKYYKYFNSYNAPERPEIPSVQVTDGKRIRLKWYVCLVRKIRHVVTAHLPRRKKHSLSYEIE